MSEPASVQPAGIVVDLPQRLIQITWRDDVVSVYAFDTLRRACPCAECRPWIHDILTQTPREIAPATRQAVGNLASLQDIQPVGSYALHFNWADGHTAGIYDWNYLRTLDPAANAISTDQTT